MDEINVYNIPAFQRKRSLAAKGRKKTTLPKKRKTASRSVKKPTTRRSKILRPVETNYNSPSFIEQDLIPEIYEREPLPSQELFEEFEEKTIKKSSSDFRELKICGICEGYFDKIDVAIIKVTSPIRKGDQLIFEKEGGLFEQVINSIQIDRKDVSIAKSGSDIGVKVFIAPKVGTHVYKEL
ncbi:hypothetical protein COY05_04185 [Candidatus Peregrinibacteria bacterium CG_4_10_14_0_2_um_filter_38_24]|nr:MAG: hypothetical protein COY05_04185 [Candidatus Peregrinibacteria bacterium CG_4_10_14_0_2_um_filter_38_24]PJC38554.1 MAG: hypothetical protein CO044_04410 [Candidatus Peregrinibacteria bacterium CG_4_9_14_0_2_um_filter_38_9]